MTEESGSSGHSEDVHPHKSRRNQNKNLSFLLYVLMYMLLGTVVYSVTFIIIQFIAYRKDLREARISVFTPRYNVPSVAPDFWITAFFLGFGVFLNTAEAGRIGFVKHVRYPTFKLPHGCMRRMKVLNISNEERWQQRLPRQMLRAFFWGLFWAATFGSVSVAVMYAALESTEKGAYTWTYGDLEWLKGWDAGLGAMILFPLVLYVTAFTCEEEGGSAYVHKRPRGMHHHDQEKGRHHDCEHSSNEMSHPVANYTTDV